MTNEHQPVRGHGGGGKALPMQTAEFFASRKARADFKAFDKLMRRRGGKRPRTGDELPPR